MCVRYYWYSIETLNYWAVITHFCGMPLDFFAEISLPFHIFEKNLMMLLLAILSTSD